MHLGAAMNGVPDREGWYYGIIMRRRDHSAVVPLIHNDGRTLEFTMQADDCGVVYTAERHAKAREVIDAAQAVINATPSTATIDNRDLAEATAVEIVRRVRESECWFCEPGQGHSVSHHVGEWEAGMVAYAAALHALDACQSKTS
jgi:hypothetical protein